MGRAQPPASLRACGGPGAPSQASQVQAGSQLIRTQYGQDQRTSNQGLAPHSLGAAGLLLLTRRPLSPDQVDGLVFIEDPVARPLLVQELRDSKW